MTASGRRSSTARRALIGLVGLGAVGALAGLVRGLQVYPPTAWFAVIELGLPSVVVGAIVGRLAPTMLRRTLPDGQHHAVRWEAARLDDTGTWTTDQAGDRRGRLELRR